MSDRNTEKLKAGYAASAAKPADLWENIYYTCG